ncbi:MAG TPA: hypothetical protein VFL13_12880 [Candidatus Baltobacteraceae bacterium]|nr:hypothetical protein [Candidatus Baltobacteraceae bacterium]
MNDDIQNPDDEDKPDDADKKLNDYDKAVADSFPASDPPVQP